MENQLRYLVDNDLSGADSAIRPLNNFRLTWKQK